MNRAELIKSLMFSVNDNMAGDLLQYPIGCKVISDQVGIEIKTDRYGDFIVTLFIVYDETHRTVRSAQSIGQLEQSLFHILDPLSVAGLLQSAIAIKQNEITALTTAMIATHAL